MILPLSAAPFPLARKPRLVPEEVEEPYQKPKAKVLVCPVWKKAVCLCDRHIVGSLLSHRSEHCFRSSEGAFYLTMVIIHLCGVTNQMQGLPHTGQELTTELHSQPLL